MVLQEWLYPTLHTMQGAAELPHLVQSRCPGRRHWELLAAACTKAPSAQPEH